ncbi:hypothetical protein EBZ39_06280 [bacterium]|nr:hypothetical protein [bacterium]
MRPRGGVFGASIAPSLSAANSAAGGAWHLREAEQLSRAATWPGKLGSPTQLANLQLWLDASDSSTLYDSTTSGARVAAGGTVARWEDKSGNGNHCVEATNKPTRVASQINGLDVVRFNGTSTFLKGSTTPGTGNVRTVFAVGKSSSNVGGELLQLGEPPGYVGGAFLLRQIVYQGTYIIGGDLWTNNLSLASAVTFTSPFLASVVEQSNSSVSYYHNGTSVAVSGALNSFNMAAGYYVGKAFIGSNVGFWPGDVCEIVIYNSALSSGDRISVQNYLNAKWKLF